jgi:hypothetical protein
MSQLISPLQKIYKTMEAPQNRRFYGKMEYLSLWPSYIREKGRTLGQTYGIKMRCYWEHPWGTHWEHEGNMVGTKEKNPPATQNLKAKKIKALWVHAEPSHWLHEISIFKTVCHFWPGLNPHYELGVLIYSGIFQLSSFEFERLLKNCLKRFNSTIQVIFFNLHEWLHRVRRQLQLRCLLS